jgi:iron complex transport system permease protein
MRLLPWLLGLLALMFVAAFALTVGPGEYGVGDVLRVFADQLRGTEIQPMDEAILWQLRLPRVLLAMLVGAALGSAGAVTQGLFRNPLASPDVLGISTGAAAAVVIGFALGIDEQALWITPVLAAGGAGVILALLFGLTMQRRDLAYLLLTGVALSALTGAISTVTLATFVDRYALAQKVMVWMLGSFDGRGFLQLGWASGPIVFGLLAAWALHRPLDLLVLGEETAATLGVDRARLRFYAATVVGVLVGTATAAVGTIGFVGLIVPHLARTLTGQAHVRLIPACMLCGAALVLAADTLGRALTPMYLAPGAVTSLLGGVFFLWLLRRQTEEGA